MTGHQDGPLPEPPPAAVVAQVFSGPGAIETISRYAELLATDGIEWGLLGPREVDRLWERHLLNSVAVAPLVGAEASVVDVGSGAGLPGIPLAIARPDLTVTLLEPLERRVEFLARAVSALDLDDRVAVQRGRSDEVAGRYDVVTARAVAPLRKLVPSVWNLVAQGGELLAVKGVTARQEVAKSSAVLSGRNLVSEVLEVRAHPAASSTHVVRIRRRSR